MLWGTFRHPHARTLILHQVTSFGDTKLDTISSVGTLHVAASEWSDHESVQFSADESQPHLLMLPHGCYALVPTQLPIGTGVDNSFAFSTEFGALLEPGEGFGWQGYQGAPDALSDTASTGTPSENALDNDALMEGDQVARLARIQRLYSTAGVFQSGITSLCSAV